MEVYLDMVLLECPVNGSVSIPSRIIQNLNITTKKCLDRGVHRILLTINQSKSE